MKSKRRLEILVRYSFEWDGLINEVLNLNFNTTKVVKKVFVGLNYQISQILMGFKKIKFCFLKSMLCHIKKEWEK